MDSFDCEVQHYAREPVAFSREVDDDDIIAPKPFEYVRQPLEPLEQFLVPQDSAYLTYYYQPIEALVEAERKRARCH